MQELIKITHTKIMTQNFFSHPIKEVLSHFKVNEKEGLTADEVIRRQQEYGLNELEAKMKKSFINYFLPLIMFSFRLLL
mgnify:CR=1 FL=1